MLNGTYDKSLIELDFDVPPRSAVRFAVTSSREDFHLLSMLKPRAPKKREGESLPFSCSEERLRSELVAEAGADDRGVEVDLRA
jgi:hypothetical protein